MIITRYSKQRMAEMALEVEFLTPTFLGGADQKAQLRAAPFKNLLRQWWRVVSGPQFSKWQDMLQAEGNLFGSVQEKSTSVSDVRISLTADKNSIKLRDAPIELGKTRHPEVGKGGNGMPVGNALYLGYGPITFKDGTKRYIAPGSKARMTVAYPKAHEKTLKTVLQYIHSFGTIGSRSRNGWGSVSLSGEGFVPLALAEFSAQPLQALLNGNAFPSALGKENGLLCWQVKDLPGQDWKACMTDLGKIYMTLRTSINIKPQGLKERHILGYPVTNHSVGNWGGNNGRMPSQLRLMVKRDPEGRLVGRILHLPHKLPKQWDTRLGSELSVWRGIHQKLDSNNQLQRVGGDQ